MEPGQRVSVRRYRVELPIARLSVSKIEFESYVRIAFVKPGDERCGKGYSLSCLHLGLRRHVQPESILRQRLNDNWQLGCSRKGVHWPIDRLANFDRQLERPRGMVAVSCLRFTHPSARRWIVAKVKLIFDASIS